MKKAYVIAVVAALSALGTWAGKPPQPAALAAKMAEQLFRTKPEVYKPIGCDTDRPWYGGGKMMYCVVATWVNALECAHATGNKKLEARLLDIYPRIALPETKAIPEPDSVDNSLFGALPLEVAILCGNPEARRLGFRFADAQWEQPLSKVLRNWAMPSPAEQKKLVADGYSTQTRLWIDDMYMITALQVQAARAAKGKDRLKYLDRAAHQMHLYVEKLQRDDGLFNHSFDVPIAWGRGNGWMAGGMTLLLGE
ncbi:MAG: glycoside hydrolase family 88 protein, partial [Kiritimatiellae bacterium]|nr:glycoside hydrolase family 88 protein [Kiritimatiellia bacterium]